MLMSNVQKKHSFFSGTVLGLVLGVLVVGFGSYYANDIKVSLLTMGSDINSVYEHMQSMDEVAKTLQTMAATGLKHMVLVGSPKETVFYKGEKGVFTEYDENNAELLEIGQKYPEKFSIFCAINPADSDKITKLEDCLQKGAKGAKLYSGHSDFYDAKLPLDHESMKEFYAYLEDKGVPVIFHVNLNNYEEEFENVLKAHPQMKVLCPYYCLSSKDLGRLEHFFTTYPNFYTNIAFGYKTYAADGFNRISESVEKYREFITKYADRFMFGTGTVVTGYEGKDFEWLSNMFKTYRNFLEKEKFTFFENTDPHYKFNGLNLSAEALKKIYNENWGKFLGKAK